MAFDTVSPGDPRFTYLIRSKNARWASSASDAKAAARVVLCYDGNDVAAALERSVRAGIRPTVRSGGHCYENFVADNPKGDLIDLSLLNEVTPRQEGGFRVGAGIELGTLYEILYKRHNVTLPGGSCPTVGAGGHITGGGYGFLSRMHGLTVDWLSAAEIATVDASGKVALRRVDASHDPELFRALRGGGGNNFGIITHYEFDRLPEPPQRVTAASYSFAWADLTPERFARILHTFGNFWATRGKDADTIPLFSILLLSHQSSGHLSLVGWLDHAPGGSTRVLDEYMGLFDACGPVRQPSERPSAGERTRMARQPQRIESNQGPLPCGPPMLRGSMWIDSTIEGYQYQRAKYGSCYMRRDFTDYEVGAFYKHLTRWLPGVDLTDAMVQIDSYGGQVNVPARREDTAVWARESVMKLQWEVYWTDPQQDGGHLQWKRDFYTELYSGPNVAAPHQGAPYPNELYEGCYINYPDVDMLAHPWWPQLYYGTGDVVPLLRSVKRRYDPNNIFHHAMSIRA